ncbi:hypothetical protein MMC07_008116, partial [Pseudocyphellaria aurata]|nr:hypothetical protein [Pseudocyphellaria aurata]
STSTIQAVFDAATLNRRLDEIARLVPETSLSVTGYVDIRSSGRPELCVTGFSIISVARRFLTPSVRSCNTEILGSALQDHVLRLRHIYIRNPVLMKLNSFRSQVFYQIRIWFETHGFLDFSAPLITPSLLYEPKSAIHVANLRKEALYLSQCAGFYMEAAAHAHERVYNLGPSFRNESRTNRHLMEYWHIKAELCSGSMEDIIRLVEVFLHNIWSAVRTSCDEVRQMLGCDTIMDIQLPFERITYRAAIDKLRSGGFDVQFGANIGKSHERWLTEHACERPLWITNKPKSLEPFPYSIDPADDQLTMTADLVAPNGFGEICGVAEKSFSTEMLDERLKEKSKTCSQPEYQWVRELRDFGMVPHTAFGMGFERMLRWLCGNAHVKDNIPFPRIFDRYPLP